MTESTSEAVDNPNEPLDIYSFQDLSSKVINERRYHRLGLGLLDTKPPPKGE